MQGTVSGMMDGLAEQDLVFRPYPGKRSLGELLGHLALLCEADLLISDEASEEKMAAFYTANRPDSLEEIRSALTRSADNLRSRYDLYTAASLEEKTTSWWGVTCTRYGWLVQIAVHFSHHRGQLHGMLLALGKDPKVSLFE